MSKRFSTPPACSPTLTEFSREYLHESHGYCDVETDGPRSPGYDHPAQPVFDRPFRHQRCPPRKDLQCCLERWIERTSRETREGGPDQSGYRGIPDCLGLSMKFGVVIFPGSNCDHDCYYAIETVIGKPVEFIWHQDSSVNGFDAIILPGGFAYGDYLRTGALAKFSPVMKAIGDFANKGGLVCGICNGFQILTEAGLLPGALMRNVTRKYICKFLELRVETAS